MIDSEMHEWEVLDDVTADGFHDQLTARMRVPGGWLYRYERNTPCSHESRQIAVAMVFVPAATKTLRTRPPGE